VVRKYLTPIEVTLTSSNRSGNDVCKGWLLGETGGTLMLV